MTYSLWDDVDAIKAFAGDDIDASVYFPEDERYLIEQDDRVKHYEVVAGGVTGRARGARGRDTSADRPR